MPLAPAPFARTKKTLSGSPLSGKQHLFTRRKADCAVTCRDGTGIRHGTTDQKNIPPDAVDASHVRHVFPDALEIEVATGEEFTVLDIQSRKHQSVNIDDPPRSHQNPVRIDYKNVAVRLQRPVNRARVSPGYPVEHGCVAIGLAKLSQLAGIDGKAFPVDYGTITALLDLQVRSIARTDLDVTVNDTAPSRV